MWEDDEYIQCVECLSNMQYNIPCPCIQCDLCLMHYPLNTFHKCLKKRNICTDCNNVITSASKNCTKCFVGGSFNHVKKLIMKYSLGMENCIMDIHLNTYQNEMLSPQEFLSIHKPLIINEINPLLKEHFVGSTKIYFFFIMKMQKLEEDTSYEFSETQIKSSPELINVQDLGLTEDVLDLIISDLNDKYENDSCEGSGWSLQSLSHCIVQCAATYKLMRKKRKNFKKWY